MSGRCALPAVGKTPPEQIDRLDGGSAGPRGAGVPGKLKSGTPQQF